MPLLLQLLNQANFKFEQLDFILCKGHPSFNVRSHIQPSSQYLSLLGTKNCSVPPHLLAAVCLIVHRCQDFMQHRYLVFCQTDRKFAVVHLWLKRLVNVVPCVMFCLDEGCTRVHWAEHLSRQNICAEKQNFDSWPCAGDLLSLGFRHFLA
mgnify:CR=1 FL=1